MVISGYTKFGVGLSEVEKREYIMAAARKVFARMDYQKATARDIIAEAGISSRTFYSYFRNKEDVLIHLLDKFAAEVKRAKDVEPPDDCGSVDELRERVARLAVILISVVLENRDTIKLILEGLATKDETLSTRSEKILDTFNSFIKEYIEIVREKGFIYDTDAEILSSMLLGIYLEMARKYIIKNEPFQQNKFLRELLSLFERGVFNTENKPSRP